MQQINIEFILNNNFKFISMKKLIAYTKDTPPVLVEIVKDIFVGYYIYVIPPRGSKIEPQDHLQDTLEMALEFAEEEFSIKRDEWKEVSDDKES